MRRVSTSSTKDSVYLTDSFLHAMDVTTKGALRVDDDSRTFTFLSIFCNTSNFAETSQFYEPISEMVPIVKFVCQSTVGIFKYWDPIYIDCRDNFVYTRIPF